MNKWKICVSIIARDTEDAIQKIEMTKEIADIVEIRLDSMEDFVLERIIEHSRLPILATFRDPKEGGFKKEVKDDERAEALKKALELGIDYIDVELEMEDSLKKELFKAKKKSKIIVSKHFFEPVSEDILYDYAEKIYNSGADIGKLVGYARSWKDNLVFLKIIEEYNKKGFKFISFAMGQYGRLSRIVSPMFGAAWTYAALKKEEKAAPGQIDAFSLKKIWKEMAYEN